MKALSTPLLVLTLALTLVGMVLARDTNLHRVKHAFNDADIPCDVDIKFNPDILMEVTYVSVSNETRVVHSGITLTMNDTHFPPSYALGKSKGGCNDKIGSGPFVIAMIDPDAPTPQNTSISQVRHFLGANFMLGYDMGLRNTTPALSRPIYPRPQAGSDPHRYVFLLYNQPADFNENAQAIIQPSAFRHFNISQFALDTGLGNPRAGTFMYVGPDPPLTR